MAILPPVPMRSPVLEGRTALTAVLHREMVRFFDTLRQWLSQTGQQVGAVALEAQGAAVVTTVVPASTLDGALYRASYSLRITQAATTSSSAAVTFGWVSSGIPCSQAFVAVTGNTTASQSSDIITIDVDSATSVTYAVAYTSVGATSMTYAVDVRLERLP